MIIKSIIYLYPYRVMWKKILSQARLYEETSVIRCRGRQVGEVGGGGRWKKVGGGREVEEVGGGRQWGQVGFGRWGSCPLPRGALPPCGVTLHSLHCVNLSKILKVGSGGCIKIRPGVLTRVSIGLRMGRFQFLCWVVPFVAIHGPLGSSSFLGLWDVFVVVT